MLNRIETPNMSSEPEFDDTWVRELVLINKDNFFGALEKTPEFNSALFSLFKGGVLSGSSSINFDKNESKYSVRMDEMEHEIGLFELSDEYELDGKSVTETVRIGVIDYVLPDVYEYIKYVEDEEVENYVRTATADRKIKGVLEKLQR